MFRARVAVCAPQCRHLTHTLFVPPLTAVMPFRKLNHMTTIFARPPQKGHRETTSKYGGLRCISEWNLRLLAGAHGVGQAVLERVQNIAGFLEAQVKQCGVLAAGGAAHDAR